MLGTHAQGQDVCAASSPSGSGDLSSSSGSSRDSAREFNIEVLDLLTSEDFAWLPLPTTGHLPRSQCAALCAHLHTYLSFYAPPTSSTDDEVALGDILAYVTKVAREFRKQRYDDNNAPFLYVRIQVGQASCSALLDSGATRNFMSQAFMQRAGQGAQVRRKANPTAIKLADGRTQQLIDRYIEAVPVYFAPHACEPVTFNILGTDFDIILGMPWLASADHTVNFHRRTLTVRDAFGAEVPCTIPLSHPSIRCQVVTAKSFRATCAYEQPDEIGLCFLSTVAVADSSPTDLCSDPRVVQLLDEFTDIFDSPTGVVPDRPISHEIILEAGAVLPKGCIYRSYGNRPTEYLVHFAYYTHKADRWLTGAELQATALDVLAGYECKMQGKPLACGWHAFFCEDYEGRDAAVSPQAPIDVKPPGPADFYLDQMFLFETSQAATSVDSGTSIMPPASTMPMGNTKGPFDRQNSTQGTHLNTAMTAAAAVTAHHSSASATSILSGSSPSSCILPISTSITSSTICTSLRIPRSPIALITTPSLQSPYSTSLGAQLIQMPGVSASSSPPLCSSTIGGSFNSGVLLSPLMGIGTNFFMSPSPRSKDLMVGMSPQQIPSPPSKPEELSVVPDILRIDSELKSDIANTQPSIEPDPGVNLEDSAYAWGVTIPHQDPDLTLVKTELINKPAIDTANLCDIIRGRGSRN
ncbi:hypothetical protein CBR_g8877 [Chara braunii]|uniref:Uncharacterized protein n=1 Tax=Chara braunii TaxID=69332 RepID=A0A388KN25_CHABU|nr:hypothetical protein CBR_g8877 [Chara braunii]|eukprot:GBG71459.1 hypothetical protein CBR_g8877 [Chara braunii]